MLISSGVSNVRLFAPASYYKLNKGFFLGFLFKQESLGKVSFIFYLKNFVSIYSYEFINEFADNT